MRTEPYWGKSTRDRWFFGFLAAATGAMLVLFSPFLYVLLFALVLVVVTWPIYMWVHERVGARRAVAAVLTVLLLFVAVFGPIGTLLYVFVRQGARVAQQAVKWVTEGGFHDALARFEAVQVPMAVRRRSVGKSSAPQM